MWEAQSGMGEVWSPDCHKVSETGGLQKKGKARGERRGKRQHKPFMTQAALCSPTGRKRGTRGNRGVYKTEWPKPGRVNALSWEAIDGLQRQIGPLAETQDHLFADRKE